MAVATLDGVTLANANQPVLFQTCRFPIMDLRQYRVIDEVVQNMNVFIGAWGKGTIAPAIASQVINVDTTTNAADACRFPVVSITLNTCSWVAPDQKDLGLESENINWAEVVTQYCTVANIADPERIGQIFNADGTFNPGNPYTLNVIRFATALLNEALALDFTHSALLGDASYTNQFDGIYPQIDYGWDDGSIGCSDTLNTGNEVNWHYLTGGDGTGVASPDAVTVSRTITLWGTSFAVPAGWTLSDFLAAYAEGAAANYGRGKEIMWEMHAPSGWRHGVLAALSCIRLCGVSNFMSDDLIDRYKRLVSGKIAELFGHAITFPIFETAYAGTNTLRFGPREIGGLPTYGLVFANIADVLRSLDPAGAALYASGAGRVPGSAEPLLGMTREKIVNRFESLVLHWDFLKVTAKCIRASIMTRVGALATNRHMWLKITNVGVNTFRLAAPSDLTIDGQALDNVPPPVPALSLPTDASSANDTTPTYTWVAATGADSYDIEVASDAAFTTIVKASTVNAPTVTYTPTALALGTYYWRVRARDNDGVSKWSTARSHTITS